MPKRWRYAMGGHEFVVQRLSLNEAPDMRVLDNPQMIVEYLEPKLADSLVYRPDVENLIVVHLNCRHRPIGFEVVTTGTIQSILVHAPGIFRSAILANSFAIILAHNHPSGDPSPSNEDIMVTKKLAKSAQLIQIELLDHVILGRNQTYKSLRELGHFY